MLSGAIIIINIITIIIIIIKVMVVSLTLRQETGSCKATRLD